MDKNGEAMKLVDEALEVVEKGVADMVSSASQDYPETDYAGSHPLKTNLVWKMNAKARETVEQEIQNCGKVAEHLSKNLKDVMARRENAIKARDAIDLSLKFLEEDSPDVQDE